MVVTIERPATRWVGKAVRRVEDATLLAGQARFVGDLTLPEMLHAAFLRSPHAHARIVKIDYSQALSIPGVVAVLTGQDVVRQAGRLPLLWEPKEGRPSELRAMAVDKVLYVGHPLLMVAAVNRYVAEDALDAVVVEYETLPAVASPVQGLEQGAALLYEKWGDNIAYRKVFTAGNLEEAFSSADRVLRRTFRIHRHTGVPIEGRGALAAYDGATRQLTLHSSTQVPHAVRTVLSNVLEHPDHLIRVVAPHVGGGFGVKDHTYGEEVCLAVMAMRLRRPVRWVEDRREHFMSTNHAREQYHDVEVAFDDDGMIRGIRDRMLSDLGAHISHLSIGPAFLTATMLTGPYRIPHVQVDLTGVVTNKVPSGSYRGWGQPQATFVMERIVDTVAGALGLAPDDVRFRNMVHPIDMPFMNPGEQRYDSGDYPEALRRVLALVEYERWRAEQERGRREGRHLGIGLGFYVECTSFGPSRMMGRNNFRYGGWEVARVQLHPRGHVTIYPGVSSQGQGHATSLAQILADELGIGLDAIRVMAGDTDVSPYSFSGTVNSRTITLCGSALRRACAMLREQCCLIGAHLMSTTPDRVEYRDGGVVHRDGSTERVSLAEIARAANLGHNLPQGVDPGLEVRATFDPEDLIYSYGVHAAVVEVFPHTGKLVFHKYAVVHDCGTVINPLLVEGQILGGIAQGIGATLLEELVYDDAGQLLTASLMDYLLPTAADMPLIVLDHMETPSPLTIGGMKGVGESGLIAPPAAIANAVADALGVDVSETPLRPDVIWRLAQR